MEQRSKPADIRGPRLVRDLAESLGKLPPSAPDLEEAVLGALMLEKNALMEVAGYLRPAHFYTEAHKEIYSAIQDLYANGDPVDMRTVVAQLRKNGKLEIIGGAYYIAELTSKVSSAANIEYHARVIQEYHLKREFIQIASQLHHKAYEDTSDAFEILDYATAALQEAIDKNVSGQREKPISEITVAAMQNMQDRMGGHSTGVLSGFAAVDRLLNGNQPGELTVLGARPGMGKSAMMVQQAINIAKRGEPVGIFSAEMPGIQLVNRAACAEAEMDSDMVMKGNLNTSDLNQYLQALSVIHKLPIYIDDSPMMNILELRARARRMKIKYKIKWLGVDFIQMLRGVGENKNINRDQEIGIITRTLKAIAKELEIPVLAISALGRETEKRGGSKRPQLSDLRECLATESSMIWQDNGFLSNTNSRINLLSLNEKTRIMSTPSTNVPKGLNTVFRLKTKSGRFVDCTENHQILTDHGYVKLKDVTLDDSVVCCRTVPEPKDAQFISESKFIGWMIGNGSYTGYCVPSFITNDQEVINEFNAFVFKKWGFPTKPHKHWSKKVFQVDISKHSVSTSEGNPVRAWIKEAGMWDQRSHQKSIPEWWMKKASNESILDLLAGLYETDGSIAIMRSKGAVSIQYSTTSTILANQIVYLLSRLGIIGTLDFGHMSPKANYPSYKVLINDAVEIEAFRKVMKLTGYKGRLLTGAILREGISNYNVLSLNTSEQICGLVKGVWQNKRMRYSRFLDFLSSHPLPLKQFQWLGSKDIFLSRITSITKLDETQVFDRQVPKNNNFIVNGICVHNSGNIESDADVVIFLYRPEYYHITQDEHGFPTHGMCEVIVAKNRNGSTDTVLLKFIGKITKFKEWVNVSQPDYTAGVKNPGSPERELPFAAPPPTDDTPF